MNSRTPALPALFALTLVALAGCNSNNGASPNPSGPSAGLVPQDPTSRTIAGGLAGFSGNLIPDPGFESGFSGFYLQDTADGMVRSTARPISGSASLVVTLNNWGSNVWWDYSVAGTAQSSAKTFTVVAKTRGVTTALDSPLMVCADASYSDTQDVTETCSPASTVSGVTTAVKTTLTVAAGHTLSQLSVRLTLQGPTAIQYYVDDVSAYVGKPPAPSPTPSVTPSPTPSVAPSPTPTPTLSGKPISLSAVWANDGGDKVSQDEHRVAKNGTPSVINSVWDGNKINVFGAKNEVVAFNLVLEAAVQAASNVSVTFNTLTGPGGATISSTPTSGNGVFNWTSRNIENFYIRYLQIKGLSLLSYEQYDERHIPKRFQRPWTADGQGSGVWTDRPDHNKYYPDIAVPLELKPSFSIAAGQNQSIWSDIYIPETTPTGSYAGTVTVNEGSHLSYQIPVQLTVRAFTLPETPTAKTMLYFGAPDVARRYTGQDYPNAGTPQGDLEKLVRDRHFQVAHRHKISMVDSDNGSTSTGGDAPSPEWVPRLNGSLFTAANGYAGPGVSVGNNVYSVGTYGSWSWQSGSQSDMWNHTNAWENWFQANAPSTERFLYLIDESTNYPQTEQWAQWIHSNPGVGRSLKSFATIDLPVARNNVPDLDIAASWVTVGDTNTWQTAANAQLADPTKRFFCYNGKRPSQGSFATDDDGVSLRELAWAQYKKGVERWFFWESTYYNDYQGGRGQTDVFNNAMTFGGAPGQDSVLGETSWNHTNGDGLLFYPGSDSVYPASSYNIQGPIASLRLKQWRRGIQDVDYLALAKAINPTAVQTLMNQMVPKAMWDYGVTSQSDPTYVRTDISWSINPNDWENARKQLAHIIDGQ